MHYLLASIDIKVLEKIYSREIGILNFGLLSGAFRMDIMKRKNKAIELTLFFIDNNAVMLLLARTFHLKRCNSIINHY